MKIAYLIDPISTINRKKDTSLAFVLAGQKRGHQAYYFTDDTLAIRHGQVVAQVGSIQVSEPLTSSEIVIGDAQPMPLSWFDVVMMRQDPPFNERYLTTTYLLDKAQNQGAKVINDPTSVRSCNEKLFALDFPQCCPEHVVSCQMDDIKHFLSEQYDVIVKPLNSMGGDSIFRLRKDDPNVNVILETITQQQTRTIMAQRYLPEIKQGDKRILIVNGHIIPFALARLPSHGETRGNLAAGGQGKAQPISQQDRSIAEQIVPTLIDKQLNFVGIDVIGDYLTEINVTSPTCIRELDEQCGLEIAGTFWETL